MVGCCWLWSSLLLSHWHVNGCFIFSFSVTVELCLCFSSTAVPVQRTKRGIQSLGENVKRKKKFTDELLMRRKTNHVRNFAKGLRSMSTGKRINKYHVVLLHIAMIQRCGQFSGFSVRKGQKTVILELCVCISRLPKSDYQKKSQWVILTLEHNNATVKGKFLWCLGRAVTDLLEFKYFLF